MSKLSDWIKENVKEGANVAEAEELVQAETFEGIKTKEQAIDFIDKNDVFKSAKDSLISTAVNAHDDKFKETKLPEIIKAKREEWTKEMNPEETPEQKRIRELETRDAERDSKERKRDLEDALLTKASEIGFDPIRAKDYSVYGDKAIDKLVDDAGWYKSQIELKVKETVKGTLAGKPPKDGDPPATGKRAELINQYNEAEKNGDGAKMFQLKEQIRKIPKE